MEQKREEENILEPSFYFLKYVLLNSERGREMERER